jgi:hypothetical protein
MPIKITHTGFTTSQATPEDYDRPITAGDLAKAIRAHGATTDTVCLCARDDDYNDAGGLSLDCTFTARDLLARLDMAPEQLVMIDVEGAIGFEISVSDCFEDATQLSFGADLGARAA